MFSHECKNTAVFEHFFLEQLEAVALQCSQTLT